MYMPNQPSEDLTPPDVPGPPAIGRPTTSNRGPPSSFGAEAGETAESERPTEDPSIDPDTMQPTPRRQRPRRRARARGEPGAPDGDVGDRPPSLPEDALPHDDSGQPHQDAIQQLVTALSSLNKHKDKKGNQSGTASWDSRQGPAPGVRYRSGMPPQPPKWSYRPDDLRSFARWQRKVEVWTMQVYNYLSKREAALLLYTSLTGEAEELLETATLERINHADGIDYIVSFLKSNLDTKLVYQKRKLLGDFESIVRQPSESIRGYLNRYERTESQLSAVNIFPDKMYDSEVKGYRLLERARLSPDAQRLVLIGAGYQINSKAISESMLMSFPEHKPPPVLHGRDGQPIQRYNHGGKGGKPQQTTTFPNGAAPSKSYGKGGKKGKFSPHRHTAYITEADDQDQIDDQPNDEPDFDPELEDIPEHEPDHDDQTDQFEECVGDEPTYDDHEGDDTAPADIAEVADVLTLTAQRLKATTLGRKFSGNKSIEERKKSSHCSACGVLGHWSGDPVCTKSSKGGKGSKGTRAKPDSRSKGHRDQDAQPKKVLFTVNVPDNHDDNPVNHSTSETIPYYTFMTNYAVNVVFDTFISQESFSGLMILDTACQRTCCGPQWLKSHEQLLHSKNLQTHVTPNSELFQFGRGAPVKSTSRVYLPSIIGDVECLIGAAIVNTQVPLLASNNFLEHMRAVLDFSKGIVILKTIGKTVPLHRISGHLAIEIANFSAGADSSPTWDEFARDSSWDDSQPELVLLSTSQTTAVQRPEDQTEPQTCPNAAPTCASMGCGLEDDRHQAHVAGVDVPPLHVHDGQARPCTSSVADPSPPPGGMDRPTQGRWQGTDPQQPHVCPPGWKRYGNKYGRFASCQRCNLRLRWSDKQQDWLEDGQGPSRKFSLPAPSSAEILLTSTTSYPKFRPGARALQTPKSLPAPSTSSSSRQPRPTRAPALPVTDETDLYLDTMVADDGMDFIETFSDEGWELPADAQ